MIDPREPDYSNTPASRERAAFCYEAATCHDRPAVSLITAFANQRGAIFGETATSVFRQSLQNWEWVIVDDCSSDPESLRVLSSYARADSRIRVIRTPKRCGPGAARNLGVRSARAPFIAFLDSDDEFEPTALEKFRWFLECMPQFSLVRGYSVGFGAREYLWDEGFHSGNKVLESNIGTISVMMRRDVYLEVGGMSEANCDGMEDWDFWLKCAAAGHWGGLVPEFLDWYRRREDHHDRWANWDGAEKERQFRQALREKYPELWKTGVPQIVLPGPVAYPVLKSSLPFENSLKKPGNCRRLLMIVPHLELGGADKFNLDLIASLQRDHNYEVSVATTLHSSHTWRHCFEQLTPDVFTLDTFLPVEDMPGFLVYLIKSRSPEVVLTTNSQLGYQLLPYLRTQCPQTRFVDYIHMEEDQWKSGNYPRYSLNYAPFLDLTVVSSQHLKRWMVDRGGDPAHIHVCTTNIDPDLWSRARYPAAAIRARYDLPDRVPVITYAARLCDQKQPDVLARVVQELRNRGGKFICLVAGVGPYEPWLKSFVKTHNFTELRILGMKSNEDIRQLLAVTDIYFMPSKWEGIALAIFEAMAMGAVPVAADVGGQRELVSPDCGILVQHGPDEEPAYVDALVQLLNDGSRCARMAAACRKRICEAYTLAAMGSRMADLFEQAIADTTFDPGAAFCAWYRTAGSEILEQRRLEMLANDLWNQLHPPAHAPLRASNTDEREALSAESQTATGTTIGALLGALLLIVSPRHFVVRWKNLILLRRILSDHETRTRLKRLFDAGFYRLQYKDLKGRDINLLLHYTVTGFLEGRRPSPAFDPAAFLQQHPEIAASRINPLLWAVLNPRS